MMYDIIFKRVLNCYHFISLQRAPMYNDTKNDMSVYIFGQIIQMFEDHLQLSREICGG
jgi:hypothetical protein